MTAPSRSSDIIFRTRKGAWWGLAVLLPASQEWRWRSCTRELLDVFLVRVSCLVLLWRNSGGLMARINQSCHMRNQPTQGRINLPRIGWLSTRHRLIIVMGEIGLDGTCRSGCFQGIKGANTPLTRVGSGDRDRTLKICFLEPPNG